MAVQLEVNFDTRQTTLFKVLPPPATHLSPEIKDHNLSAIGT